MAIRFTPSARAQFLEGLAFIDNDNPASAKRLRLQVYKSLTRLEQFPDSGRTIPEFPDLPHREVIVKPYRFFYRVVDGAVWVLAVWHGAQLPEGPP